MTDDQRSPRTTTGSYRRDLMKLLGAGTAVGAFGGVAAADGRPSPQVDEPDEDGSDESDEDAEPSEGSVHVVRTLIAQSTNPERPADFFYQPTGLHVEPGDVVKFVFETPDHNVTSYHPAFGMQRRVPAGVQPFSSPIMGWDPGSLPDDIEMPPAEGEEPTAEDEEPADGTDDGDETDAMEGPSPSSWLYAFETPGVYDLECAPHEGFGMAMRVVVGEETETNFETSNAGELPPPRVGPVGFARQVLTDPNLEPDAIVEAGRVEWTALEMNQGDEDGTDGGETDDEPDEGSESAEGEPDDGEGGGEENGTAPGDETGDEGTNSTDGDDETGDE